MELFDISEATCSRHGFSLLQKQPYPFTLKHRDKDMDFVD